MDDAISTALRVFRTYPECSEEELVEHLVAEFGDEDLANRLYEFIPIAFAREFLAGTGIKFSNVFHRRMADGKISHACPLNSEPIWALAVAAVQEEASQPISEQERLAILYRSAEFNTFEKAKASGVDMRGGVSSPPIFLRPASLTCERKTPWWQFWKK